MRRHVDVACPFAIDADPTMRSNLPPRFFASPPVPVPNGPPSGVPPGGGRLVRLATRLLRAPVARVVRSDGTPLGRVARRVARDALPLRVTDVREAPRRVREAMESAGWGALLVVPLPGRRSVLLVADTAPRAWSDDDLAALRDLAATVVPPDRDTPLWLRRLVRREAHEARRKNEARLALIFDSTSDLMALVAVEADGFRCAAVNGAGLALTGLAEPEVLGRRVDEVLHPATWSRVRPRMIAVARNARALRWEEEFPLPLGRATFDTTLTPVMDDAGRCTHVLAVARDVTARVRVEAALRDAIAAARAGDLSALDRVSVPGTKWPGAWGVERGGEEAR